VRVELGSRSYSILVGPALLGDCGHHIAQAVAGRSAIVVSDRTVADLYLQAALRSLQDSGFSCSELVVEPGESSKDLATLCSALESLLSRGIERGTTLIALGGGVIGDLTGFAASILLRGIPYVQIPTTLLAQVDSSVGGKTGVNSEHGKNLIGSFYQPQLVLADVETLGTLPQRERRAGYAEVAKYGLIDDAAFFSWLEAHGRELIAGDPALQQTAVAACCRAKARIVADDEREVGARALLNLGHTFAHALETEAGYSGSLLHGEAVAFGIVLAYRLSTRLGLCAAEDTERVTQHFRDIGLPSDARDLPQLSWDPDRLIALMGRDKKVRGGRITFVLTRGIGHAFLSQDVPSEALRAVLEETFSAASRASQ
jgi:3-dehydroquinate synthase